MSGWRKVPSHTYEESTMQATRLKEVLGKLLEQEWAVFLWGAPGIGKSSIVHQVAEERNLPVVDLRATLLDPTDLRGIPMLKDGTAVWCPPAFLPKEGDTPGILFLDELNAAPPLVQAGMYQLVLDHAVGEYRLPEGWRIIAAGNRAADRAVTFRLSSALANRFVHLELEQDIGSWTLWAQTHGIESSILGFLNYRPSLLLTQAESGPYASPRTWEMLSDTIKAFGSITAVTDIASGIVGEGPANEFLTFARDAVTREEIEALKKDPQGAPLPTRMDRLWSLVGYLSVRDNAVSHVALIVALLSRLPIEFSIILLKNALTANPRLFTNPEVIEFMRSHANLFK